MKSRAAVLYKAGQPFEVCEIDVQLPKVGEVLVEVVAAGVCHTDYSVKTGQLAAPLPAILGHEGAGIVREVGEGSPPCSRATMSFHSGGWLVGTANIAMPPDQHFAPREQRSVPPADYRTVPAGLAMRAGR